MKIGRQSLFGLPIVGLVILDRGHFMFFRQPFDGTRHLALVASIDSVANEFSSRAHKTSYSRGLARGCSRLISCNHLFLFHFIILYNCEKAYIWFKEIKVQLKVFNGHQYGIVMFSWLYSLIYCSLLAAYPLRILACEEADEFFMILFIFKGDIVCLLVLNLLFIWHAKGFNTLLPSLCSIVWSS